MKIHFLDNNRTSCAIKKDDVHGTKTLKYSCDILLRRGNKYKRKVDSCESRKHINKILKRDFTSVKLSEKKPQQQQKI